MSTTTPNPPAVPGLAVIAALLVAAAAAAGVWAFYKTHDPIDLRKSTSVSQSVKEPEPQLWENKDDRFLYLLEAHGLQTSGDPAVTIDDAHSVCSRVTQGETERQIIQEIVQGSATMSAGEAAIFADTAINVYCPQG